MCFCFVLAVNVTQRGLGFRTGGGQYDEFKGCGFGFSHGFAKMNPWPSYHSKAYIPQGRLQVLFFNRRWREGGGCLDPYPISTVTSLDPDFQTAA
jgi:hypothetical protein